MIVDRLFAAAELRLGGEHQKKVRIVRTDEKAAVVTDAPQEEAAKPESNARPPQEMRLRPTRAPVMRLSRRVLVGLGVVAAAGMSVALFFTLQPQRRTTGAELYNTDNRSTPDGLANLPRNYGELPRTFHSLARRCRSTSAGPSSMPGRWRRGCRCRRPMQKDQAGPPASPWQRRDRSP